MKIEIEITLKPQEIEVLKTSNIPSLTLEFIGATTIVSMLLSDMVILYSGSTIFYSLPNLPHRRYTLANLGLSRLLPEETQLLLAEEITELLRSKYRSFDHIPELVEKYSKLEYCVFIHHSGKGYMLNSLANTNTKDHIKFPVSAVYCSLESGEVYQRPLEQFDKNFTLQPNLSCDGCGYTGPTVRDDGHGFNCCYNPCDQYSVRGVSRSDFF